MHSVEKTDKEVRVCRKGSDYNSRLCSSSGRIYNDANLLGSDFWKRESIGSGHNDEVSLSTTGTKNIVGIMSYWVPSVYNSLCTAD